MVVALALTRGAGSPLSLPLALLGIDVFAFSAASVGLELTGDERYSWLGAVVAPLFVPTALHFVLGFVGGRARHARLLRATYALHAAQSLLALLAWVFPSLRLPGRLAAHAGLFLLTSLPLFGLGALLVFRHLRRSPDREERLRARVLLGGLVVVSPLLLTDLLAEAGFGVPRYAFFGAFVFSAMLTYLTLGLGVLARNTKRRVALAEAFAVGLFGATVYLGLFVLFRERLGVLIVAATALSLAVTAVLRASWATRAQSRQGLERFATLGRFSGQMAHDLKNPLAAAKGAAQYLSQDLHQRGLQDVREFSELVVQQLDRVSSVIDRYQRLSRLEPELAPVDLDALIDKLLSLQTFAAGAEQIVIERRRGALGTLQLDPDLFSSALENLVKNALEAMPSGGVLTVETALTERGPSVTVRDTGKGMSPRALEQAFELFFTTKATGSGLGLAFVKQVIEAHGGEVHLTSVEGKGTEVQLSLSLF